LPVASRHRTGQGASTATDEFFMIALLNDYWFLLMARENGKMVQ
jgi:hypothetical protein